MAHPQDTQRGYLAKARIDVGSQTLTYNSTALLLSGGVRLNAKAAGLLTSNSTGVNFPGAAFLGGQATVGKVNANSTAILLPATGFQMASLTSLKVTSNSTGIKIGSLYVSCNSTGNTTT